MLFAQDCEPIDSKAATTTVTAIYTDAVWAVEVREGMSQCIAA